MKIIFFGTGKFGLPALKGLIESDHEVAAVVTQPDRKKGRGWNVLPTPVKAFVEQTVPGIDVIQPERASDADFVESLRNLNADILVVIDYGQILSKEVLAIPKKYCINLHPSLLPKYRGASPVNQAILNGDRETGNTIIKMTERMDAGDIIIQKSIGISDDETVPGLFEKLSRSGADLLAEALKSIGAGEEQLIGQNEDKATYAPKLKKNDGEIDWTKSARSILRNINGMQPWPSAFTHLNGRLLKIIEAELGESKSNEDLPGTIYSENEMLINTGDGTVKIKKLQLEGKKPVTSTEFLRGHQIKKNSILGEKKY